MSNLSRRKFLITAAGSAAGAMWLAACGSSKKAPTASKATGADAPEVPGATLGFIALTDAAPLIIAKEKGFFAKYGMPDVNVVKQTSWAVTRDNLELGSAKGGIDGAHILSPMPLLLTRLSLPCHSTRFTVRFLSVALALCLCCPCESCVRPRSPLPQPLALL